MVGTWLHTVEGALTQPCRLLLGGYKPTCKTRNGGLGGVDRNAGEGLLSVYAEPYCRVQQRLFAEVAAVRSAISSKQE